MNFGSVCSGIGAPELAWRDLPWRCSFMSEIAAAPRAVLQHKYPQVPLHGDFTTIQSGDYDPIDLLVGGTPCQAFSVAGLRGGMADARGNLALEYLRLAERLRPRWLVWENVPGVRSSGGGRDFGAFLGGMGELGYGWAYRSLDAQYAGLAQRRERVFVIGHLGDWRCAAAVLFEPESLRGNPPPRRETRERIAASLTRGAESGGRGGYAGRRREDDSDIVAHSLRARSNDPHREDATTYVAYGGNNTAGSIDVATALNAHPSAAGRQDFESETFVTQIANAVTADARHAQVEQNRGTLIAHTLRAEGHDASEDGTGRGVPLVPFSFQSRIARNGRGQPSDVIPALNGSDAGDTSDMRPLVAFDSYNQSSSDIAHTLRDPNGTFGDALPAAHTAMGVRRLTPEECCALQGFPRDYFDGVLYRGKPLADGPKYQMLGNSMAVPVLGWLGKRIAKATTP